MIATINTRLGGKDFIQAQVLPARIAYFGDSMSASAGYPDIIYGINGITRTNYAVGGTSVCTATYAPSGGNDLIDKYNTEISLGYTGQLVSFVYLQNDLGAGVINATWKATYKAIIQAFITAGWPLTRLLLMNEPCLISNAAARAPARAFILQIAGELGILYYDVYQRFVDTGVNDSLFGDVIHPNSAGQDVWANGYFQFLRR